MEERDKKIRLRWAPVIAVGLVFLVIMFVGYLIGLKELGAARYKGVIDYLSSHLGLNVAVFIYSYLTNALIMPLSPDLVWLVAAGMSPLFSILLVGLSATLGGFTSYGIGYAVDKIPFVKRMVDKLIKKWDPYIKTYGVPFIVLAAILPMPFSTICFASGVVRLGVKKAFPPCLLRFVHAAIYCALFKLGLLLV